jgi:hypothetical protein
MPEQTFVWTLRAEQTFKKFLRTWPGAPKEIARAIIEAGAFKDGETTIDRDHVILGLNRYNRYGDRGEIPFTDIEIIALPPYGFRTVDRDEMESRRIALATRQAEEWRSE